MKANPSPGEFLWLQQVKSSDITLPTKVCLVKAMVFHVVMYGCESWTVKMTVVIKNNNNNESLNNILESNMYSGFLYLSMEYLQ